jgi:hypothetical protein
MNATNPIERQAAWMRETLTFAGELLNNWGLRLASWLVIGNAGAMVLALNAVVNGTRCDTQRLAELVAWFAAGLILAFAASAVSYLIALRSNFLLGRSVAMITALETNTFFIEKLKSEGVPEQYHAELNAGIDRVTHEHPLIERKHVANMLYGILALIIYALSAVAFAGGLLTPVFDGGALIESCAHRSAAEDNTDQAPD